MNAVLKRSWADELREHLRQLRAIELPAPGQPGARPVENVVRPAFRRAGAVDPARPRPELAAALAALMEAAGSIEDAEARADEAERCAAELSARALARIEAAESRAELAEAEARAAGERAAAATRDLAEQRRAGEAQLRAARDAARALDGKVAALAAELETASRLVADANDRVFAAETRALEAQEDIQYLEGQIRARFALRTAALAA